MIGIQTKAGKGLVWTNGSQHGYTLWRATCLHCGKWDGTWFRKSETARKEGDEHARTHEVQP